MTAEIVILGGGVGGTLTANRLAKDVPGARIRLVASKPSTSGICRSISTRS